MRRPSLIAWMSIAVLAGCAAPPAGTVDLAQRTWRAKAGFTKADRGGLEGPGVVRGRLPLPLGAMFPEGDGPARSYAVAVTFDAAEIAASPLAGLLVRSAGQALEVYLNGRKLAGQIEFRPDGALATHHLRRKWLVALPAAALRPGVNTLVMHVAGDAPAVAGLPNFTIGLHDASGYVVGPFNALLPLADDWHNVVEAGLYLVLGVFALVVGLFVGGPPVITLALFSLLLAAYTTTRSAFALGWFPDTNVLRKYEFVAQYLASAAYLVFFAAVLPQGRRLARVFVAGWLALAVVAAAAPVPVGLVTVSLWQASVLVAFVGVLTVLLRARRRGDPDSAWYAFGFAVVSAAVVWDVVASVTYATPVRLVPYGMLLFVASLGANLAARFLRVHRAAEASHAALTRAQDRLTAFYGATLEAICLRDGAYILEVNPAFTALLGFSADEAAGRPFTQLFDAAAQTDLAADLAAERLLHESIAVDKQGRTFAAELEHRPVLLGGRTVVVTAIRDITARKAAEDRLRLRNHELEAMNQVMVERELRMVDLKREIRALGGA